VGFWIALTWQEVGVLAGFATRVTKLQGPWKLVHLLTSWATANISIMTVLYEVVQYVGLHRGCFTATLLWCVCAQLHGTLRVTFRLMHFYKFTVDP